MKMSENIFIIFLRKANSFNINMGVKCFAKNSSKKVEFPKKFFLLVNEPFYHNFGSKTV